MKTKKQEIFEEDDDDEDDIYEGLPNFDFDHALKKFQVKNHSLEQEVSILKKELEESIKRSEELGAENINLRKNISCLFKTAEAEIKRKERSIADLRRELDSVVFRRRQGDRNAARIKTRLSDTLRASHSQRQNTSHVKQIGGVEHSSPSAEKSSMHLAPSQHAKFLHEAEVQASTPYNDSAVTSSPTICEYQQYRHSTKPKRMYVSESEDEDDEPTPQGNVATLYSKRMKAQFLAMKSTSSPNNTQGPDALSNSSKKEKSHQGVAGEKASESSGKCSSEKQASERPNEAAISSVRLGKTDNHLEKKDEVHNGSSKFARLSLFEQCVKKKFVRSVGSSRETAIRNQHQSTNEIHAQLERPHSHTGRKSKAVSPEPLHTESAIQQVERSLSRSSSSTATSQLEEIVLHTPLNRCVERPHSHTGRKSKAVSPEPLHTESAIQQVERSRSQSSSSTATSQLEEIGLHTPLNRCVPKEGPKLTRVEQSSSSNNVLQQEEVGSLSSESSSQQMQKTESFTSVRVQQVISLSPNDGKNMAGDTDTKVSFTVASEQCEFKRTKRRRPFTILIAKGPIVDTPSKPVSDDKVCRVATCTDDENLKPQGEVNKSPKVINKSPKVIKSDNVNSNHLPKSELKRKLDNIPLDAIVHPKKRKINWEDSEFSEVVSAENTKEVKVISSSVVKEKENKAEVVNVTKESKDQKHAIHSDRQHRNGKYRSRNEDRKGSQKSRREISRFRASDRNAIKSASYRRSKSRSRSNEDRRKRDNSPSRKMWSCREKTENDGKREKLIMIIKKKSVKHSDSKYSKDKDHKKVRRELVCTAKEEPKKSASDVAQRKQSECKREKYQNCSDKGNVLSRYANKISEQSEKSIAQTKVVTIPISPKFKNRKCNFGDDTSVTEAAKSSPSKETRLSIVAASNEVLSASNKEESSSTEEGEITSDSEND